MGISEGWSRRLANEYYWSEHDIESYECSDCGRGLDRVTRFDVHHIDGDPLNNNPDNLVGLCKRCHIWGHNGKTISGYDVEEWKEAFLALGDS